MRATAQPYKQPVHVSTYPRRGGKDNHNIEPKKRLTMSPDSPATGADAVANSPTTEQQETPIVKPTPSSSSPSPRGPPSAMEFEPPLACVRRILKHTLPSSTNVGKDASAAFARASGIFIIYVTACANDFARENRRQTITANDVLAAIKVSICYASSANAQSLMPSAWS
jgi:histone H3/H4